MQGEVNPRLDAGDGHGQLLKLVDEGLLLYLFLSSVLLLQYLEFVQLEAELVYADELVLVLHFLNYRLFKSAGIINLGGE